MSQPAINGKAVIRTAQLPQPPVDNEHVVPGGEPFSPETVAANKSVPLATIQGFFDELMAERNRPHCGDQWKAMVDGLCRRAQTRGLWTPPEAKSE